MRENPKNKTAILINSPESLFLSKRDAANVFIVVFAGTPLAKLAEKNFPVRQLIYLKQKSQAKSTEAPSVEFGSLIGKTDLTAQLLKYRVKSLLLPYRNSAQIEAWAKKNGIILLATSAKMQERLENKKYFDGFLKKYKISSPPTITKAQMAKIGSSRLSYVVQEAKSSDYFRTKFYTSGAKLFADYKKRKMDLSKTVIRQYLAGIPVGVSIFLDKAGNGFCSSLRTQCFYNNAQGFPKSFLGLQWLPLKFFMPKLQLKINRELAKLASALSTEGFTGVANVDFIVNDSGAYIFENNPRLSVATPQVFSGADFAGYHRAWNFFEATFNNSANPKLKKFYLPNSAFAGSVLSVEAEKHLKFKSVPPLGVYTIGKNKVQFKSSKLADFNKISNSLVLVHELVVGQELKKGYDLCRVFANFALFDFKSGLLNSQGQKVFDFLNKLFN